MPGRLGLRITSYILGCTTAFTDEMLLLAVAVRDVSQDQKLTVNDVTGIFQVFVMQANNRRAISHYF